jgi:hypothetical protein
MSPVNGTLGGSFIFAFYVTIRLVLNFAVNASIS